MKFGSMIFGLLLIACMSLPAMAEDKAIQELLDNSPAPAKADCDNGQCSVTRSRTVVRERTGVRRGFRVRVFRGCRGCR